MEENRSLGWTLVAAVATYALLVSTSWKMGVRHGPNSNEGLIGRIVWHAVNTFLFPYETVCHLVNQALSLAVVRGSFLSKGMPLFAQLEGAMAHLTLSSTVLLEVPASQDPGPHLLRFLVPADSVAALHPLELTPVYVAALLGDTDVDAAARPPSNEEEKLYLRLPDPLFYKEESLQEREALLMCGFAAVDQVLELGAMDERGRLSRVRAWAVLLQAGGYALGVAERWKRGLGVSPVEAMLCVCSVPILMQILIDPPAARLNYDRPLLLRLRVRQFTMFRDMPRLLDRSNSDLSKVLLLLAYLGCSFFFLPSLTIYYSFHYSTFCPLCSLSTLLLLLLFMLPFFAPTLLVRVASKYNLGQDLEAIIAGGSKLRALTDAFTSPLLLFGVWQVCTIALSITLAFISTITHWDSFNAPTNAKLSWLLPHFAT
ncbi:hypothetical protein GOP47_0008963 [Adiantum capillus-veneris]|uniref:Uncharacterized protein n=1 Tax=Adiantum capillus-veneris TaxID=13818 RepID=A0A9D4ZII4_ADICA|nr:hypothetical protein GOP47_0008963 [Adiantum capillus-veneris]